MRDQLIITMLLASLALVACGNDDAKKPETQKQVTQKEDVQENDVGENSELDQIEAPPETEPEETAVENIMAVKFENKNRSSAQTLPSSKGSFDFNDVPLGASTEAISSSLVGCKLKNPFMSLMSRTLTNQTTFESSGYFFPDYEGVPQAGYSAYLINGRKLGGLDQDAIYKKELHCDDESFSTVDLWFIRSTGEMAFYEKSLDFSSSTFQDVTFLLEQALEKNCNEKPFQAYAGKLWDVSAGGQELVTLACQKDGRYIVATAVEGGILLGTKMSPSAYIGYMDGELWQQYVKDIVAIKDKEKAQVDLESDRERAEALNSI